MERHILISGAGIAGPTLAWWLHRYGWRCTVLEQHPTLRTAGQNIDIRGAAREVIRRMGLDDVVAAHSTGERGTRFVDAAGRSIAEFPVIRSESAGATAEREILRGQLSQLLFDRTRDRVDYRFGSRIRDVRDESDSVAVTFADGAEGKFDVVVIAEGVNSGTRAVVSGLVGTRELGVTMAYCSIEREPDDDEWWRWYQATGGRTISLRPDNVGRTRALLSFLAPPGAGDPTPQDLRRRFADAGWAAERVLAGLAHADDLYVEPLRQIKARTWSRGRSVLLGDAGWCATPISGMGTSLALFGAYVLAGQLAAHVHHQDAFAAYERVLRPYVARVQQLPPGAPRVAHPRSRVGLAAFRTALRVAASPALATVRHRLLAPPADRFELPDFRHLESTGAADGDGTPHDQLR